MRMAHAATAVPTEPLIYRFYELISVYGTTFKELIHEEFGGGIMSAIDFNVDIKLESNPNGDRVRLVMSGKFRPYKPTDRKDIAAMENKPPLPPFILETAQQKVQKTEDAWSTRDPERVAPACTDDSERRNRSDFFQGGEKRSSHSCNANGAGAGLPVEERVAGIHRKPHRRALRM